MNGDVYSIRLLVERQEKGYRASWLDSFHPGSRPFDLELPLGREDTEELRWYLEKFHEFVGTGTEARARDVARRIEDWGRQLFEACFPGVEGTHVYRNLTDALRAKNQVLLTLGSEDSDFLRQPWELMRDHRGPLIFQGVSIRRQLVGAGPVTFQPPQIRRPLRILLIVARPRDAGFIDPRSSMEPILDSLESLPVGAVELSVCRPPTLARFEEMISTARREAKPFHIVHFDGHGYFHLGVGGLSFENEDRSEDRVGPRPLGDLLSRLEIPLVVLEACRTSGIAEESPVGSLAPALLARGVSSVVAFSHSVHVKASRILVGRLYGELANGLTVGQALSEGRAALRAQAQRPLHRGPRATTVHLQDWFIPQLYQVGGDPALLQAKRSQASLPPAPKPEERMAGFPLEPVYGFQGRARDLRELEWDLERFRAVQVTGVGGLGKTALAREAAIWWLRTGRFEKAVFVSFEQPMLAGRVAGELGRAFEGPDFLARGEEDQLASAAKIFHQRRVLLVWDNFESTLPQFQEGGGLSLYPAEELDKLRRFYQQLVDKAGASRLVVTCRPVKATLRGIKEHPLAGLDRPDSLHLIHAIADLKAIDLNRPGYERSEIELLLDQLNDHPLSISLVGPHLSALRPAQIREKFAELLEQFEDEIGEEGKNRSLLASLAFSTSRLRAPSRALLPFLAAFRGGACEQTLLAFSKVPPESWPPIRAELEGTALVQAESIQSGAGPFLRFHPTLPYAVRQIDGVETALDEMDFLALYSGLGIAINAMILGSQPAAGMELMGKEEPNFRLAIEMAFRLGKHIIGWQIADPLINFLGLSARSREHELLAQWTKSQMPSEGSLDHVTWAATCDQAQSLSRVGKWTEAEGVMRGLIARQVKEKVIHDEDPSFFLGTSYGYLAKILESAQRPEAAVEASFAAIAALEGSTSKDARGNLGGAWGALANAYLALGRLEDALEAAERSLSINRELQKGTAIAAAIFRRATILAAQKRFAEAEAGFREGQSLAESIGDLETAATAVQHRAKMLQDQGKLDDAVDLYQQAIQLAQKAGDLVGEMRLYDLLASAERLRGKLQVAEAWYSRARQIAAELDDRVPDCEG